MFSVLFSSGFSTVDCRLKTVCISPISYSCYRPKLAYLSLWTILVINGEDWKLWSSFMWGFLHVLLSTLVTDKVIFCSCITVRDQVVHPPSKTDKIIVFIFWSSVSTQQSARFMKDCSDHSYLFLSKPQWIPGLHYEQHSALWYCICTRNNIWEMWLVSKPLWSYHASWKSLSYF
jgi:hypothetical protein